MSRTELLLSAADRIGFQLCRDSIWDGHACNWMGWASDVVGDSVSYSWQSLGPTAYDGTAGIADFLACLFSVTHDPLHRTTALAAIEHAIQHQAEAGGRNASGIFSGGLGIAAAAIQIGLRLEARLLVDTGIKLLRRIATTREAELELDVIGGCAGAIPLLIGASRQFDMVDFLDLAVQQGEYLLQKSTRQLQPQKLVSDPQAFERCWKMEGVSRDGLTGYSHGNAGFTNALLELYGVTGDQRFMVAAQEALAFERRWFDTTCRNWFDLRTEINGSFSVACAWCHGAPGIGLARMRTKALLPDDPLIDSEIQSALTTTIASICQPMSPQQNFSLCHGLMGNMELPYACQSSGFMAGDAMNSIKESLDTAVLLHGQSHKPWRCGTQDGRMTPGLMLGTAGIGLAILRFSKASSPHRLTNWLLITPDWFV